MIILHVRTINWGITPFFKSNKSTKLKIDWLGSVYSRLSCPEGVSASRRTIYNII